MFALFLLVWIVTGITAVVFFVKRRVRVASILSGASVLAFIVMLLVNNPQPPAANANGSSNVTAASLSTGMPPATTAPATAAPTADPTEPPTPKPDHHAERAALMAYWDHVMMPLAFSQIALDHAKVSLADGSAVDASGFIKLGQSKSADAKTATITDQPAATEDISTALFGAANAFEASFTAFSEYLDDEKPSHGADAVDKANDGRTFLTEATHLMRVKFRDLGGDPMNIKDAESQHAFYKKLFDALGSN